MGIFRHENMELDLTTSSKAKLYKDGKLLFIGDGYTQSELDNKYLNDVNTNVNYLFKSGGLIEPFPSYANYFNIYAVSVASSESGADEPTKNVYKSTALDASFAWGFPDHTVDHSLFFNTKLADYAVSTAFTGTGIIPPPEFTLNPSDKIFISIENLGTLENEVIFV